MSGTLYRAFASIDFYRDFEGFLLRFAIFIFPKANVRLMKLKA